MQDASGLYYYPDPTDIRSRVYVRQGAVDVEFRLWHKEHPEAWDKHGWVTYTTIQALAAMYKERGTGTGSDPLTLYDINVAKTLIKEHERKKSI